MLITSLSTFSLSIFAVLLFIAITVGPFLLIRPRFPAEVPKNVMEVAAWGAFRIGTIHALILALVFTEVRVEYSQLSENIEEEALAVEQLYRYLDHVEGEGSQQIQQQLIAYTHIVVNEEWPSLVEGKLFYEADVLVSDIRGNLVSLLSDESGGIHSAALLDDINDIENMRGQRTFDIEESLADIFWVIIIMGYLFTVLCFLPYPVTLFNCFILSMFASINGVVLFSIVALTHPFVGAAAISPIAFESVIDRTMAIPTNAQP